MTIAVAAQKQWADAPLALIPTPVFLTKKVSNWPLRIRAGELKYLH